MCRKWRTLLHPDALSTPHALPPPSRQPYEPFNPNRDADAAAFVAKYMGSPCILMWAIGNELDHKGEAGAMMALAAQGSRVVKGVDPSRPTTTCLAGFGALAAYMQHARAEFDTLCINCYLCADTACATVAQSGYRGNYILGEYGVLGWWEVPTAPGSAMPLEPSSTTKAISTASGHAGGCAACGGMGITCLAAFVFTNERKIEGSPTWFGLVAATPGLQSGALQPVTDRWAVVNAIWSGAAPSAADVPTFLSNRGIPTIASVTVDGSGFLPAHAPFSANLVVGGSASAVTAVEWEVRLDITAHGAGGASEPPVVAAAGSEMGSLRGGTAFSVWLTAPAPGRYRLSAFLQTAWGVVTASAPLVLS